MPSVLYANQSVKDIPVPHGYERVENHQNSFGSFLRTLPLKKNKRIQLWDGSELDENHYSSLGVIDLPLLFDEDLEQCADFAMRIWADYLKNNSQLRALALFDYNGRKKPFVDSGKSYLNYLKTVSIDPPTTAPRQKWRYTLASELGSGYEVFLPVMPNSDNAKYEEWKIWFERHFQFFRDGMILIGNSQGGYFLAKYLSENQTPFLFLEGNLPISRKKKMW